MICAQLVSFVVMRQPNQACFSLKFNLGLVGQECYNLLKLMVRSLQGERQFPWGSWPGACNPAKQLEEIICPILFRAGSPERGWRNFGNCAI